jgi:hypothetical protein
MMYRIAAATSLAALFLSAPAVALTPQTTTLVSEVTLSVPSTFDVDGSTALVGIAECERMVTNNSLIGATFGMNVDTTVETGLYDRAAFFDVDRDSSARVDCESGELCRDIDPADVDQQPETIEVEVEFEDFTEFTDPSQCADIDREFFIRLLLRQFPTDEEFELADARVIIDTIRPVAPSVTNVTVTDSRIRVEFDPSTSPDLLRYRVLFSTEPLTEGALPDELEVEGRTFGNPEVESGEVTVDLAAGQTVYVAVAAQDETGNFSPLSNVTEGTALETTDFWEAYKQAGGREEGGCSHTPAAPTPGHLLWLAAAGIALALRRRTLR